VTVELRQNYDPSRKTRQAGVALGTRLALKSLVWPTSRLSKMSATRTKETAAGFRARLVVACTLSPACSFYVPAANHDSLESIVRMASIPHGTIINAQGPSALEVRKRESECRLGAT
jgi:hypothetical protein